MADNIDKVSKHKISLNEMADIEQYLSKEKGIDTVDELIAYLKKIDPNNIEPELKKLGLKSAADRDEMIEAEERAKESIKTFSKIVEDSPVFNVMNSDSVLSIVRHLPPLKELEKTVAAMQYSLPAAQMAQIGTAMQSSLQEAHVADLAQAVAAIGRSFEGLQMTELAQIGAAIQSSFGGSQRAELAQAVAAIQSSFGEFEQLSSKLWEVALITSATEKDLSLTTEESAYSFPPSVGHSLEIKSEKEASWDEHKELLAILKDIRSGMDADRSLTWAMAVIMTLDRLEKLWQSKSLADPWNIGMVLAVAIVWIILLTALPKEGHSVHSAGASNSDPA